MEDDEVQSEQIVFQPQSAPAQAVGGEAEDGNAPVAAIADLAGSASGEVGAAAAVDAAPYVPEVVAPADTAFLALAVEASVHVCLSKRGCGGLPGVIVCRGG